MENKFCRLCWNTAGWRKLTGEAAELESNSYVAEYGYGLEEWLFNYKWLLGGYRYGYMTPLGAKGFQGHTIDICMYTIDPDGNRLLVGVIRNAYIPTDKERSAAFKKMKKRGWIDQMLAECESIGIDTDNLDWFDEQSVSNVRFKPEDVEFFDPLIPVDSEHKIFNLGRYTAYNWEGSLPVASKVTELPDDQSDQKRSEETRERQAIESTEYEPVHIKIQNKVYDLLKDRPDTEVLYEHNNIDLMVLTPDKKTLIEIKTAPTARLCIRQALGQLLEYAHYSDAEGEKELELVVMGDVPATDDDFEYIDSLREQYGIPLHYSQYMWHKNKLKGWGEKKKKKQPVPLLARIDQIDMEYDMPGDDVWMYHEIKDKRVLSPDNRSLMLYMKADNAEDDLQEFNLVLQDDSGQISVKTNFYENDDDSDMDFYDLDCELEDDEVTFTDVNDDGTMIIYASLK